MGPGTVTAMVALGLLLGGFARWRRRRLLTDVPTSKVRGVFIGLNEVKGTAEALQPLVSKLTHTPCVWFSYRVQEEHTRTVTSTGSNGQSQTHTEHYWKTRDQGGGATQFEIADDTGRIRVDPTGAKVTPKQTLDETRREDSDKGFLAGLFDSATGKVRYTESAIALGTSIYVMAPARLRSDSAAPELAADPEVGPFVVSTWSEEQLLRSQTGWLSVLFTLGVIASGLAGTLLIDPSNPGRPWSVAAGLTGASLVAAIGWLWLDWNSLVRVRQRQDRAASLIDVQLSRRADLVPNLADVVAAAAAQESTAERLAAEARTATLRPDGRLADHSSSLEATAEVTRAQTAALRSVMAVAERYPDLRAQPAFTELQLQLTDTENRIALARQYYNDSVTAMADRSQGFPTRLVARLGRFTADGLYLAEGFERTPATV